VQMRQRGVDVDGCQGVNEQKAAELMWLAVSEFFVEKEKKWGMVTLYLEKHTIYLWSELIFCPMWSC